MRRTRVLIIALLGSVLLHLGAVFLLNAWYLSWWAQSQRIATQALPPIVLVDLVTPANRIRPDHARFAGVEHNTTTQETVAVTRARSAARRQATRAHPQAPTAPAQPVPGLPQGLRLPPATAVTESVGLSGDGVSVPEDYFPNFRRGAYTYVNTLRHPHVGYFVEIKRALKIAWAPQHPILAHRHSDVVRRGVVGCVVGAAVDPHGNLVEVFILKGSGLPAYDEEAIRTFRVSAPFFAPPAALFQQLGQQGLLRMSWAMIVNVHA